MDISALRAELVGPLPAVVTPMGRDGQVDFDALAVHVDYQIKHGVTAVIANGMIGESPSLTTDERMQAAEVVMQRVDGRALTLVTVTHDAWPTMLRLAQHAAEIGADALLVSLPPSYKLDEKSQRTYWTQVEAALPLPFILYASGNGASTRPSVELVCDVATFPGVVGVKDSSPDVARLRSLLNGLGPEVPLIAAGEKTLPDAALAGLRAAMTASVCFAPQRVREVFDAATTGRTEEVRAAFEPIAQWRSLFQALMDEGYPSYIQYTKAACDAVGLPAGPVRPPLSPLDPEQHALVVERVQDLFAAGA